MRSASAVAALGLVVAVSAAPGGAVEEPEDAGACSSVKEHPGGEWPSYGGDLANSRSQPAEDVIGPDNVAELDEVWHFNTSDHAGGLFHSTPIVARGCVFVVATSGEAHALDADSGEVMWSTQLDATPQGYGGGVVGAPGLDEDRLIVVINRAGSPYLAGLDTGDGEVLWTTVIDDTSSAITNASVTVYDGMAFVGFSGSPAGQPAERGGYVVVDTAGGEILVKDWTIPDEDYEAGYYGASIWSTAAVDTETGYAYVGSGNPHSDRIEHEHSNAILKIDLSLDEEREDTFGRIVGSYKGDRDQYVEGLDEQPACQDLPPVYYFPSSRFDATCAQLDLDFGASPNLFPGSHHSGGGLMVGALQKSGAYHAADADTMEGRWRTVGGVPCLACNASTSAFDGEQVYVSTSPPGQMLALDKDDGDIGWVAPIGGGLHYFSVSHANGVVYTPDTYGYLNAYDAETGMQLAKFGMGFSYSGPSAGTVGAGGSSGVAIARNTVYVAYQGVVYAYGLDA
jgi:polyvinyl alcohol dehydrogenase (cytochrome)